METVGFPLVAGPAVDRATTPSASDLEPILGTWRNAAEGGTGVAWLVLAFRDGSLVVRAHGAGGPAHGDWGEVEATAHHAGPTASGATAFSAVYDLGSVTSILAGYAEHGLLVLDALNSFPDRNGRPSYFTREYFHH